MVVLREIRLLVVFLYALGLLGPAARAGLLDFNLGEGLPEKIEKGNEAFRSQNWDEALKLYADALVDGPDSEVLRANMGKVLYKQGRFDEAREAFEKLLSSSDRRLRARAHYDLGNALYRLATGAAASGPPSASPSARPGIPGAPSGMAGAAPRADPTKLLQASLESYIEGLKLDPEDEDAKYNVEYIRRKIKERQKQEQQKQDQQKQEQKQDEQKQDQQKQDEQKQDQQKQDQQKQDQQKQDEQKQDEQKQDQQKQDEQKQDQDQETEDRASRPEDEKAIPKEQALKKLDELREHEKRELKRQMERRAGRRGEVEYDW